MKKMMISFMVVATACMFLTGCSASTPTGTDSNVKELVMQIAQDELRAQLTTALYAQISRIPINVIGAKVTYAGLKAKASSDKSAKQTIAKVDEVISKIAISLENIRTNKIEKEIKKSFSSADLRIGKNTLPVEYTAQINADGELYVEVFGLKF